MEAVEALVELNKNPATGCQNEKFVSKNKHTIKEKNIHIYGPRDIMDVSWALIFRSPRRCRCSPFHHPVLIVIVASS